MENEEYKILRDKILQGIQLAIKRLIIARQKEDGELVVSSPDGKVIRVKARDIDIK